GIAFGTADVEAHPYRTIIHISALHMHPNTVRIHILHILMIERVALIGAKERLTSAYSRGRLREISHQPVHRIDLMNCLSGELSAPQPIEVTPVSQLILKFGLPRLACMNFRRTDVIVNIERYNIANYTFADFLHKGIMPL